MRLGFSLSAESSPTSKSPVGFALLCPQDDGICSWSIERGWEPLLKGQNARLISSFWQTSSGSTVVLLRGHQEEGRVLVLDEGGSPMTSRYLDMALGLSAVSAEDAAGDVILCNATIDIDMCDIEIPPMSARGPLRRSLLLPLDCLFPRFGEDGRATCFRRLDGGVALREVDPLGRFVDHTFPWSWLPDDVVRVGASLLLRKGDRVYIWKDFSLDQLKIKNVLWIYGQGEQAYVASCEVVSPTHPKNCHIETIDEELSKWEVWRSESLSPTTVRRAGADRLLVDASNAEERELVFVTTTGPRPQSETVWRQSLHHAQ